MAILTVTIPQNTYNPGTSTIPATATPAGAVSATITFDVTNWTNPLSRLDMALEMSSDNGLTWVGGGAFGTQPNAQGQFTVKGVIVTSIPAVFHWPTNITHLRGTVTISGASITTAGSVIVS